MASHMEAANLERFLVHILTPVYRLIEDDTIRDSQMGKCFYPILLMALILTYVNDVHRGTEDNGRRATGLGAVESWDNEVLIRIQPNSAEYSWCSEGTQSCQSSSGDDPS
jgi:hypothetical protein